MPTPAIFASEPPFPEDVPLFNLTKLSYKKLLEADPDESRELFRASAEVGFFVLDLQGTAEGEGLLRDASEVLDSTRKFSVLEDDEKSKYAPRPGELVFGWKPAGAYKNENSRADNYEFYSISQDDIVGNTHPPRAQPAPVEHGQEDIKSFLLDANGVTTTILSHLDVHLGLATGTLEAMHQLSRPSHSTVRLIHIAPRSLPKGDDNSNSNGSNDNNNSKNNNSNNSSRISSNLFGHTDNGTLTVLFNVISGLQILPPGLTADNDKNWRWVRPEPGCAIVNLGDALVQWSGGILRSNMHRVVNPGGQQAGRQRYSYAYVQKPDNQASMRALASNHDDSSSSPSPSSSSSMSSSSSSAAQSREGQEDEQYTYASWLAIKAASSKEGKNMIRVSSKPVS